jgi:hypothetical protein
MGSGMTLCGGYGYVNFDVLSKSQRNLEVVNAYCYTKTLML